MKASAGRSYLAIPGPSVVPERVLKAMHAPSPNIYEGPLVEMMPGLVADLKKIAGTEHMLALYIGNGHAAWEAALANVLAPGDKALVLATGMFCKGWGDMAEGLGADIDVMDFGNRATVDFDQIEAALTADQNHRIKALLTVHVDTSSSVRNDIAALRALLDRLGHPALLMVDCIASLGCDRYEMDEGGADVTVSACQKGLMTPAGIAMVWFNEKAAAVRAAMPRVSRYWDWTPRANADDFWRYWDGTAPTHLLMGLREATTMIFEEGIEQVWARHAQIARAYWAAVDSWAAAGVGMELNITDPANRSNAVTSVRWQAPHATELRRWVQDHAGITLGIGLGMSSDADPNADGFFRIGHMGHVNMQMALSVIGAIEAGLVALGHKPGGQAPAAAAEVLAGAR